jgi:hypothetical protein
MCTAPQLQRSMRQLDVRAIVVVMCFKRPRVRRYPFAAVLAYPFAAVLARRAWSGAR